MSVSGVSASSYALSYLQQVLQQGKARASDASGATDALSMLTQPQSGGGSSVSPAGTTTSALPGQSRFPAFDPNTMSTLISLQSEPTDGSSEWRFFAKLDGNSNGKISKAEFGTAAANVGADSSIADAVFHKIDLDRDGSLSQDELTKADHASHRYRIADGPTSSAEFVSNDEGSKGRGEDTGSNTSAANQLEKLIRLQSQMLNFAASTLSAVV